jgi:phage terminase large subunit-like protein
VQTPRIHSKLNDLPSKGQDMIDFSHRTRHQPYGMAALCLHSWSQSQTRWRWAHSELGLIMARQQGKSHLMMLRILTGMFVWGEGLQLASAHRLTTSLETFRQIVGLIETNPRLEKEVKKIRWQHGAEEIELFGNRRFVVKAANNAARGLSKPETIHLDELREYKDEDAWSSMRYSMMAAKNPQVWIYSQLEINIQ